MGNEIITQPALTIDIAHELLRDVILKAQQYTMQAVVLLHTIRDTRLWEDARDYDGDPFPDWSHYLKWAVKEFNISRALAYNGLTAYSRFKALNVAEQTLLSVTPTTLKRASDHLIEEGEWTEEIMIAAEESGIPVTEKVAEILSLPTKDLYQELRTISAVPMYHALGHVFKDKHVMFIVGDDDANDVTTFRSDRPMTEDMVTWLEGRLRCTFTKDEEDGAA